MTLETALNAYMKSSKLFEKTQPCEPAWLAEHKNPSPHKEALEKQLTAIIREKEPRLLDEGLNILLAIGSGGLSCSISNYTYWLGMRALRVGTNQALSELDGWFNREKVDAYCAVVALGPQIKMPIKVNDKIVLYPANECPDYNLLSDLALDSSGLAVFDNKLPIIKTPVIIAWEEMQVPRVYGADKPDRFSYEIMEDAIRMVSIINRRHYYIHRRTSDLREHEPLSSCVKSHSGSKSDAFFADWKTNHNLDVQPIGNGENYQNVFDDIWQKWEQCDEKLKSKIRLAIDRWSQSQHRATDEDKAIEMRVALEALLIEKEQVKISSTIRDKVKLICSDNEEPPKLAYDIYNAGSRIMHEGKISNSFEKKSKSKKSPRKLLKAIHSEFPQMVRFVIENGIPILPNKSGWVAKVTQLICGIVRP